MSINIIAVIDLNGALGYKNKLLCHLPNDLKRFKELTTNNYVVMGRKTYESIGKPLPNRTNIVLTKNKNYYPSPEISIYHKPEKLLEDYYKHSDANAELFICGGGEIYKKFLSIADKIYLTVIDHQFNNADVFFPKINLDFWKPTMTKVNKADENHRYNYSYVVYERRDF